MTNFEKYKTKILELLDNFAVEKRSGKVDNCLSVDCTNCKFDHKDVSCINTRIQWLYEEYVEQSVDWSKVAIDTKVMVSDDGKYWNRRYFAGVNDKGRKPMVYSNGLTSWSAGDTTNTVGYKYTKLAEE